MIADDFIITKDFRTYTTIILRDNKRLRDHAPTAGAGVHYWVARGADVVDEDEGNRGGLAEPAAC
jgi:hypothetical protein